MRAALTKGPLSVRNWLVKLHGDWSDQLGVLKETEAHTQRRNIILARSLLTLILLEKCRWNTTILELLIYRHLVATSLTELQESNTRVCPPSWGAELQTGTDLDRSDADHTPLLRGCAPPDDGYWSGNSLWFLCVQSLLWFHMVLKDSQHTILVQSCVSN